MLLNAMPNSTPRTFFFGPPHALKITPPTTPPAPKADRTVPSMTVLFPVWLRIMGASSGKQRLPVKLIKKKASWRPRSPLRARMYLNPNMLSSSRLLFACVSADTAGWGMRTIRRAPMATTKVMISNIIMPPAPTIPRRTPAATGAKMPDAFCARLSMPLALPYCSLSSMVLTAAL